MKYLIFIMFTTSLSFATINIIGFAIAQVSTEFLIRVVAINLTQVLLTFLACAVELTLKGIK